jgi:hypothetical protein
LGEAAEFSDITITGKVDFTFRHLVIVPEHIRADGIKAAGANHFKTMLPISFRYTREVHLTAANDEWLTVKKKRSFADLKSMNTFIRTVYAKNRNDRKSESK